VGWLKAVQPQIAQIYADLGYEFYHEGAKDGRRYDLLPAALGFIRRVNVASEAPQSRGRCPAVWIASPRSR
jgi:hypothetical protein